MLTSLTHWCYFSCICFGNTGHTFSWAGTIYGIAVSRSGTENPGYSRLMKQERASAGFIHQCLPFLLPLLWVTHRISLCSVFKDSCWGPPHPFILDTFRVSYSHPYLQLNKNQNTLQRRPKALQSISSITGLLAIKMQTFWNVPIQTFEEERDICENYTSQITLT